MYIYILVCMYQNGEETRYWWQCPNYYVLGTAHGTHDKKTFDFNRPVQLRVGTNYISILAGTVGLPVWDLTFSFLHV